jgi:hypothetical protein
MIPSRYEVPVWSATMTLPSVVPDDLSLGVECRLEYP